MEKINLNDLRDRVYKIACNHGWHEKEYDVNHYIMLVITELAEAINADRINKRSNRFEFNLTNEPHCFIQSFETYIKDTVEDELADAVIRILDIFGTFGAYVPDFTKSIHPENDDLSEFPLLTQQVYLVILAIVSRSNLIWGLKAIYNIAKHNDIDLLWHIEQKIKYNEMRPYKYGGKKY